MRVAIIGAGFGGLAAAYRLAKSEVDVSVFESEEKPGGLAIGFEQPRWKWSLEAHYHHWFTNDYAILNLAKEIEYKVITIRPKTSTYIDGWVYQLDSPLTLLKFDKLSFIDRLRTGAVLAYLKLIPFWKPLETITAEKFIKTTMGEKSWKVLWRPLFEKKFSYYSSEIPASWFWSRIYKRTPYLAYPEGGYLAFARRISEKVCEKRGKIFYKTVVESVSKKGGKFEVKTKNMSFTFDRVICTLPSPIFVKIAKGLPGEYKESLVQLKGIGAVNLVLSLKKQFLSDGTYWLNINERDFPFVAVVEHTNFMDKRNYNNERLLYIGNYLPHEHEYFKKEAKDLISEFMPFLKKINPQFSKSHINESYLFKAYFAQPIIPLNYSKEIPKFETPIKGLYLSNIQQVYPWDRGTNYAVENAEKVAKLILDEN